MAFMVATVVVAQQQQPQYRLRRQLPIVAVESVSYKRGGGRRSRYPTFRGGVQKVSSGHHAANHNAAAKKKRTTRHRRSVKTKSMKSSSSYKTKGTSTTHKIVGIQKDATTPRVRRHHDSANKSLKSSKHDDYYYYTHEYNGKGKSGGKGMSMKKSYKAKGKGKGKEVDSFSTTSPVLTTAAPTDPPMATTAAPTDPEASILGLTSSSVHAASPTASPSEPGPTITLDGYALTFDFGHVVETNPDPSMLDELAKLTSTHIDDFLRSNYQDPVLFDYATTTWQNFIAPDQINFVTTVRFFPSSIIPFVPELNQAVRVAFLGAPLEDYLTLLTELPDPNVFRNADSVGFQTTLASEQVVIPQNVEAEEATLVEDDVDLADKEDEYSILQDWYNDEYDEDAGDDDANYYDDVYYYDDAYYDDDDDEYQNDETPMVRWFDAFPGVSPRVGALPVVEEPREYVPPEEVPVDKEPPEEVPLEDVPVNDDPMVQTTLVVDSPPGGDGEEEEESEGGGELDVPELGPYVPPTAADALAVLQAPWFATLAPGIDTVGVTKSLGDSLNNVGDNTVFNRVPLYAKVDEGSGFEGDFSGICTYQGSGQFCTLTFDFGEAGKLSVKGTLPKLIFSGATGVFGEFLVTLSISGEALEGEMDASQGNLPVGYEFIVNVDDVVVASARR
eukprot:scaffold134_cov94-Amphora_coffeaeformis.AAC.19